MQTGAATSAGFGSFAFDPSPRSPASPGAASPVTVTAERRASASPFPSPGSSFLPPPIPGAHEFAIKVPPHKKRNIVNMAEPSKVPQSAPATQSSTTAPQKQQQPATASSAKPNGTISIPSAPAPTESLSAASITPTNALPKPSTDSAAHPPLPAAEARAPAAAHSSPPITPKPPPEPVEDASSPTTPTSAPPPASAPPPHTPASARSLSSSRPAPPSPAASRRTSRAFSTRSGAGSRPSSTILGSASRRVSRVPAAPAPEQAQPQEKAERRGLGVTIRDFAFARGDARHAGAGPDAPRATRRLQRPLSTWSASSAGSGSSGADDDGGAGPGNGWGVPWGLRRLSWFSGSGGKSAGGGGGPSAGDFARNFDVEEDSGSGAGDNEGEDGAEERVRSWGAAAAGDELSDEEDGGEEGELRPGLYKALYAFEPEGTAEMALAEDQLVRVVGRGGGVGWAVALREGGEHALVPEGYLAYVGADDGGGA